jgi:hypothetical protein
VKNAQFRRFVLERGYVTFAELPPKPEDYPDALPHMLRAGSLVFSPPPHPVSLADCSQWWAYRFGACWRKPYGPGSSIKVGKSAERAGGALGVQASSNCRLADGVLPVQRLNACVNALTSW